MDMEQLAAGHIQIMPGCQADWETADLSWSHGESPHPLGFSLCLEKKTEVILHVCKAQGHGVPMAKGI